MMSNLHVSPFWEIVRYTTWYVQQDLVKLDNRKLVQTLCERMRTHQDGGGLTKYCPGVVPLIMEKSNKETNDVSNKSAFAKSSN
ncbi:hypothetical protein RN001_008841 [Aquatica leii]|uniref:Uncharacterized protein n=1 Tax=Aquatica leii TaxID=1421715 RepID=A0AAN7SRI4_9COLE|nr:hypothetical protein RN001_008841 [Aquatica leii]